MFSSIVNSDYENRIRWISASTPTIQWNCDSKKQFVLCCCFSYLQTNISIEMEFFDQTIERDELHSIAGLTFWKLKTNCKSQMKEKFIRLLTDSIVVNTQCNKETPINRAIECMKGNNKKVRLFKFKSFVFTKFVLFLSGSFALLSVFWHA